MSMVETLRLVISGDSAGARRALSDLEKQTGVTSKTMETRSAALNKAANVAAIGFVGLGVVIAKSVKDYADLAIQSAKLSAQTNMSAEGSSRFIGQLQMMHVDSSKAGMAVKTLENSINGLRNGVPASVAAFKTLNLTYADLQKLSPEDQIALIRDRISQVQDPAAKSAAATALLGRGAKDMALWYSASAGAMDRVNTALERNGQILSEGQLKQAEEAAAAWQNFIGALKGTEYAIAQSVLPPLTELVKVGAGLLNILRPFAPLLGPITVGLGLFVVAVKTAAFFQNTWGQALALLPGRAAKNVVAEEAETVAITEQTVAIEANTLARSVNGASSLGTGLGAAAPALAPSATSAATLGAGATMAAATVAGVSASLTALAIYYGATYKQSALSPNASMVTGSGSGAGIGRAGGASQQKYQQEIRPYETRYTAGVAALGALMKQVGDLKPTADNAAALDQYEQKLKAVGEKYPEVKARADEMTKALDKQKPAWDQAVAAAKAAAEELKKTIIDSATSVFDAVSQAAADGLRFTSKELSDFMAAHPLTKQQIAATAAAANSAPAGSGQFSAGSHKVKYHAKGFIGRTKPGEIGIFGEEGPEAAIIGDKQVAAALRGGKTTYVDFRGAKLVAQDPEALMELIGQRVAMAIGGA